MEALPQLLSPSSARFTYEDTSGKGIHEGPLPLGDKDMSKRGGYERDPSSSSS